MSSRQRQAAVLVAVIAAGLVTAELLRRYGPTGGFAEIDGKHQAIYGPGGRYMRCEEFAVRNGVRTTIGVVADRLCKGCGGFDVKGCP